jgi:hypothetical protein
MILGPQVPAELAAIASVVARKPLVTELIWKIVRVSTGSLPFLHAKSLGLDELVVSDDADGEAGAVEKRSCPRQRSFQADKNAAGTDHLR